ncbi:MAG: NAD(P)/FAD-dependent oxidoreductase, partial [Solirubrobacterales bacterium]
MPIAPKEFPPPVNPVEEFITEPTDPEEERIEVGVAIVGGGPAGLACAIKLTQLLEDEPELAEKLGEVPVAVIEKGKTPGAHLLSGANMKPSAMQELFPDLEPSDWPVFQEVTKDAVYLLTKKRALPLVPMPPNFRNHGNYVTSVSKLGRFLAEKAEEAGVYILSETSADKLLIEDRIVKGVRSGDKGRDREGKELGNFEPGSDVVAKATVLAEGTLGHLTDAALDYYDLHGAEPRRWELGVKEVWKVPNPLDRVIHTMGWPLRKAAKWNEFGGSFIYPMGEDKVSIGLVAGLDYTDATFSVHDALQQLKTHPFVEKILEGGERVAWGAKTIPSGGYFAMPKRLAVPGMVIAGDAASMVNVPTLKGIHYAMHAGMYAAETIVEQLKNGSVNFEAYDDKVHNSLIEKDLYQSRNQRQVFSKGFFAGGMLASLMTITKGAFPGGQWHQEDD